MKEAVGESSMTIITIVLVALAVGAAVTIIGNLLSSQNKRASCDDAGYYWVNGTCQDSKGNTVDI